MRLGVAPQRAHMQARCRIELAAGTCAHYGEHLFPVVLSEGMDKHGATLAHELLD
jgi:hypothetical protein